MGAKLVESERPEHGGWQEKILLPARDIHLGEVVSRGYEGTYVCIEGEWGEPSMRH